LEKGSAMMRVTFVIFFYLMVPIPRVPETIMLAFSSLDTFIITSPGLPLTLFTLIFLEKGSAMMRVTFVIFFY
jgi:hypothetical protein